MRTALFLLPLAALLLLFGCGGKTPENGGEAAALEGLSANAPPWVENPALEGKLAATGGSPQVTGGIRFQQIEAAGRAQEILRRRIEQKSAAAAREALGRLAPPGMQEAEIDADAKTAGLMVGAQATKEFRREGIWWSPAREHYVLYAIDEPALRAAMIDGIRLYVRTSDVYWDNFRKIGDPQMIERAVERALADEGTPVAKQEENPTQR